MFVVKRTPHNPILGPNKDHYWEAFAAFNMCPIKKGNKILGLYRAISAPDRLRTPQQISTVGIAESKDGTHFKNHSLLIEPKEEWEKYGCEDPRVTYFEGMYYIFYTALSTYPFGPEGIKVAVAVSPDLKKITERHLVTPFNAKAMTLFPERINGKITVMLSAHTDTPPAKVAIAQFDDIEELWSKEFWGKWHLQIDKNIIDDPRRNEFDHIEVGAPVVKTPLGWLFVYSHIQNYFPNPDHFERIFGVEALLLDLKDPRKIVGRTKGPILAPEEPYELSGDVANVVFPSGALVEKDTLIIYYGGADTTTCSAKVNMTDLLSTMDPELYKQGVFQRSSKNPIILADPRHQWESKAAFNPAAIALGGKIHILYRVLSDDNTSTIGYAVTTDGETIIERLPEPVYVPREEFELKKVAGGNSGCEDPRLTKIGDRIYMFYTAYNGIDVPRIAATSISEKDFLSRKWKWEKPVLVSPAGVDDKDACIFPEKIKGKYFFLHRIAGEICGDYIDSLNFKEGEVNTCIRILGARAGMWDSEKVGISAPPIKTKKGWLLLYHGISKQHHTYRVGAVLLDLKDPAYVLSRITGPVFQPEELYEKNGIVNNVVFPCGMVVKKGELLIYYGGADQVVGVASMKLDALVGVLERGMKLEK